MQYWQIEEWVQLRHEPAVSDVLDTADTEEHALYLLRSATESDNDKDQQQQQVVKRATCQS